MPRYGVAVFAPGGIELQKKSLLATEQLWPDIAAKRKRWQAWQGRFDPRRLVFIGETRIKTNMAPVRGWARKGQRLRGHAPHGHWRTLKFLAALRFDGLTAPCVFDGPVNGMIFRAYVDQILVPALRPNDIVIMDNLGCHKSKSVRDVIKAAGPRLFFLLPYSPGLNPIEQTFAKIKHWMRIASERTVEAIWKCVGKLIGTIKPQKCENHFRNSGYASTQIRQAPDIG